MSGRREVREKVRHATEEIEELLGAYALDAVDDDERRVVEGYLATNPRARAEVQQHREVATMLAFTGRARARGPVGPDRGQHRGPGARARARAGQGAAVTGPPAPPRWMLVAGGIAAAVAALVVALLGVGFVERGRELDRCTPEPTRQVDLQRLLAQATADPTHVSSTCGRRRRHAEAPGRSSSRTAPGFLAAPGPARSCTGRTTSSGA